jgi:hypothetical protein
MTIEYDAGDTVIAILDVIAGLDPAILRPMEPDARVEPGHDD